MKKMLQKRVYYWMLAILLVVGIKTTYGQEITVDPGFNTLGDAITANPGATLKLLRGGDYVNDHILEITVPTVIYGETEPATVKPAVISLYADPDAAPDFNLFKVNANLTLKDVGMIGFTADVQQTGTLIVGTAPDISITLDGCIIQSAKQVLNPGSQDRVVIVMKNNKFYNLVNLGWDNWGGFGSIGGGDYNDFKAVNNSYFYCGRVLNNLASGPHGSELMEHNTYANIWGDTYYPIFDATIAVKNNIYYNTGLRGYVGPRVWSATAGDTWEGDFKDDFPQDSLQGDLCTWAIKEVDIDAKTRKVEVMNNLKFTNDLVKNQQKAITATLQPFLNKTMRSYFATYTHWILKDNMTDETNNTMDPQFEGAIPEASYELSFKQSRERRRVSIQGPEYMYSCGWWPAVGGVPSTMGTFIWPLPFNLKPTNAALPLGDDGYQIGDLNWYGKAVVDAYYAVHPVAVKQLDKAKDLGLTTYPNPTRVSTKISYNLVAGGDVSLKIYNSIGKEVSTVVNAKQASGIHEVKFNTSNLSKGVYFVKIRTGNATTTQKLVVN